MTWELTPLKKITTKIGSGATPRGGNNSYKTEGITLIRSLNVYDFEFSYEGLAFINEEQASETRLARVIVESKDILLNITGASVARCCIVPEHLLPARVNQHVSLVRVDPNLADSHYVLYCINSPVYKHQLLTLAQGGATREALTQEIIGNLEIPLPPSPIQRKIANFLDRKTEQIDKLIRIKARRIALLQEQRTALINQVVTKGLDPDVEMKPSGVEWIGEIPVHWNLSMLKYTARLVYGDTLISENRDNGAVPVYGSNGIIDAHSSANTLSPTIIVGRKGSLGKVQYSDVPCFVIDTAYFIDKRTSHANLRWLYYVLQALKLERFRDSVIPGLKREHTEGQYIPLITEEEQTQIANFLDRKTQQIDDLIATEGRKIELLKEYRQSLISEAVTGKIDVRNEV